MADVLSGILRDKTRKIPAEDFIRAMSAKAKAKFFQIANLLKEHGPEVRMPYSRFLEDGIFEVRVIVGNDSSRVLYFFMEGQRVIFTVFFRPKRRTCPLENG